MTRKPVDTGDPDRLYTVTGGRSRADDSFDLVTLIVSECEPKAGMQSEHARILDLCRHPTAVVEIAAELKLPITVVRILLGDLLDTGRITARHPRAARSVASLPDSALLKEVLHGLRNL
ncbi:hypothetical protein GCM10018793_24820 [Streptomyces sulfonofaciens]|uniref:DUF742 domain-containing protein n=1 Tax=Streptomyces sulfonofaciens TaxID=68272 RepID=A0A919G2X8_9ACTN|nr:DUF742 domain-containing protein [Streptomyces sulfonofaciens]GHH77242.1 hypothetical protein GCM10018793_24820 [Streptomyces sulfonofaciens]